MRYVLRHYEEVGMYMRLMMISDPEDPDNYVAYGIDWRVGGTDDYRHGCQTFGLGEGHSGVATKAYEKAIVEFITFGTLPS